MVGMKHLAEARERAGMTPTQLAEAAEVTADYVRKLERGDRINPSRDVLLRLASALDVPLHYIVQ